MHDNGKKIRSYSLEPDDSFHLPPARKDVAEHDVEHDICKLTVISLKRRLFQTHMLRRKKDHDKREIKAAFST